MWKQAEKAVAETFFKDTIALYLNDFIENDIGETIEQPVLLAQYICNIENGASTTQSTVSGQSTPQTLRISTLKDIGLDYSQTYKVKIIQARIVHSDEYWKVDGWIEGQISTVINVSREVSV